MNNVTTIKDPKVSADIQTKPLTQEQIEQNKKLKKTCADFEAMFTFYLLKTMRKTIPTGLSINQFAGKDTLYMLMDQKVSEEMSKKNDGLGLQKMLYNQLVKKINDNSGK